MTDWIGGNIKCIHIYSPANRKFRESYNNYTCIVYARTFECGTEECNDSAAGRLAVLARQN